jgi:STE24 endopeptidase
MPFLLLLFLTLACLPEKWSEPWTPFASPTTSASVTWLGVVMQTLVARGIALWVQQQLAANPHQRSTIQRRYGRARLYFMLGLMGMYGLSLYVFGWGWAVPTGLPQLVETFRESLQRGPSTLPEWMTSPDRPLPGAEILVLAPFFVGLLLAWACFYDAESALHDYGPDEESEPFWTRWEYVLYNARQNLALVLVPILLMIASRGLRRLCPDSSVEGQILAFAGGGLTLVAFVFMPWALRAILGLTPLPEGPLRDRLMATARRLNFRFSNILVWHTRRNMVNAMVAGIVPWVRYVLLTDRLIDELTPDEIEAVFGHEVGHVKHYHIPFYLGFLLLSLMLIIVALEWVVRFVPSLKDLADSGPMETVPVVVAMGAYVFLVFGFLSRRCERQADVYGCRAVSCQRTDCTGHETTTELASGGAGLCPTGVRTFIGALEKVALLNGISRDRPGWLQSWQHSTIGRRVAFLETVLKDLSAERRFQRRVAVVKWSLLVGIIVALTGLVAADLLIHDETPDQPTPPAATQGSTPTDTPT